MSLRKPDEIKKIFSWYHEVRGALALGTSPQVTSLNKDEVTQYNNIIICNQILHNKSIHQLCSGDRRPTSKSSLKL